uniref:RNA-directed RNA polymerase n=1 Tax=Tulasnella barnavirus 1 TaxID=2768768 RepID=A0A7G9U7U5_9VIRU|nr:putative RNA dependent RNA polymerase [Tulasnella barnavirus 1]
MTLGSTNKIVMEKYNSEIWQSVVDQFNAALHYGEDVFTMSPQELIQKGICHPVRAFVKEEPHSAKKITSGKLRIIAAVSLIEQLKTRLLCSTQNKMEIACWQSCPSKPGLGLHDEGLFVIQQNMKEILEHGELASTDIGSWDWSVKMWELNADAERRRRLAGATKAGVFNFLLRVHAYCVGHSVFMTPCGSLWAQTIAGGQLSGDYNTSSSNSSMRVCAALMARQFAGQPLLVGGKIPVCAMGDDAFELAYPGMAEHIRSLGHVVKFVELNDKIQGAKFCSQEFDENGTAYPEDPTKTLYRFLSHNKASDDMVMLQVQLAWYFRHLPRELFREIMTTAQARVERANKTHSGLSEQSNTSQ